MLVVLVAYVYATACTNFIVGKKASADGSVFTTYNADDYGMFIGLCHFPAGKHAKGEMRQIYDWDTKEYHGQIPEARETYNVIGNINEYQVSIGETTFGGRHEMVDTTGVLDYGSLIYIALQRSKTAREAIRVMTTLAETYGYCSEGETFSICDPNEAWIMDMMGKGPGSKGVVWVALRIPDDAICAHANQSRIRTFDQKDKENVMFSDDMERYLLYAEGKVKDAEPMPLWIVPNRKVTLQDMRDCMRDHYEGTPFALDNDPGQGLWGMPYRPTPLTFKVDGKDYFNERPTSTQQSGFSYIAQLRSWLPRQVGGILWFGNDDGNMVAYTPVYCGNTVQPECYNTPGADAVTFSDRNAYWVCNWVSNMVYPRYSMMFGSLKEVRDSLEASYDAAQAAVEAEAVRLCGTDEAEAVRYLNAYSNDKAQQMLARWKELAVYLIVKYNDMTVKPEENGRFKRTATGLGATVERPGYTDKAAREIVKAAGDRYAVPEQ